MTTDEQLGELLIHENLMSQAQLDTARDFQKSLGGDLRNIVVKLGYVKDSVLANLVAQEENVGSSLEITAGMLDFATLQVIPREILEKHQVIPLRSSTPGVVLAMADPNDLNAIEAVQFLVNQRVEPAVATKAAIRKTLNQLDRLLREQQEVEASQANSADRLQAIRDMPIDRLIRSYLILRIEQGHINIDELLARANKL